MLDEKVWTSRRRLSRKKSRWIERNTYLRKHLSCASPSGNRLATNFHCLMLLWQNASYASGSWFPICGQADQLLLWKRRQTRKPVILLASMLSWPSSNFKQQCQSNFENNWSCFFFTLNRQGRMLEEISGMYSSVFGTKAGPKREKHPVVFLPDGSKKVGLIMIELRASQIFGQGINKYIVTRHVDLLGRCLQWDIWRLLCLS